MISAIRSQVYKNQTSPDLTAISMVLVISVAGANQLSRDLLAIIAISTQLGRDLLAIIAFCNQLSQDLTAAIALCIQICQEFASLYLSVRAEQHRQHS